MLLARLLLCLRVFSALTSSLCLSCVRGHVVTRLALAVVVSQQKIGAQSVMEFLETAPLKWDATVNITFKKKEDIFPLQNAEMDNIKAQVESFFIGMREFRNRFRKTAPFSFSGPAEEAYGSVNAFFKELHSVEVGAAGLNELEEVRLPFAVAFLFCFAFPACVLLCCCSVLAAV